MTFGLRRIAAGAAVGLLVLGLGACGDDKKDNASDTATTETTAAPLTTVTTGATAAADTITVSGFKFSPDPLNVKAGATITISNKDTAPHTVTELTGKFDSKNVAGGATGTITAPTAAGTYEYKCNVHANMPHAKLVVA